MRKVKQSERPFYIWYAKNGHKVGDCARTLDSAKEKIATRFSKLGHKGEKAEVLLNNLDLVFATST